MNKYPSKEMLESNATDLKPNPAEAQLMMNMVLDRLKTADDIGQRLMAKQQALVAEVGGPVGKYKCSGQLDIAFLVIYNKIRLKLEFDDFSGRANFEGEGWGVGVGGGLGWGNGAFSLPPDVLSRKGDIKYNIYQVAGVYAGVDFFLNGVTIGSFLSGALAVGAGVMGGSGSFSYRP